MKLRAKTIIEPFNSNQIKEGQTFKVVRVYKSYTDQYVMALKGNENSAIVAVSLLPFFEEIIESQESNFPPTDNM